MLSPNTGLLLRQLSGLVAPRDQLGQTDQELLQRFAAARDENAYLALLHRHAGLVWGVCRRVLGHEQDAEDAFQATFLALARKADSVRQTDAVGSWLYRVAYHIASNARRGAGRRRARERRPALHVPEAPVAAASLRELQAVLDAEVEQLPEKYRVPFVLCCLEGKSKPEAAHELGWREGTVASRLARARSLLQQRLTHRGLTLSAVLCAGSLWEQSAAAAVPRALVGATARAAAGVGLGGVSAGVAALAEGALKTTWLISWQVGVALLLGFGFLAASVGAWAHHVRGATPSPLTQPADRPAAVRKDSHGDPLPTGSLARLGTLRQRAADSHLAVTPDGQEVIAVGPDLTVRRFDAQTGALRLTRQLPRGRASATWLSPGGRFVLAIDRAPADAHCLELWDLTQGKCSQALPLADSYPWGAAFSRDERRVAVADSSRDQASHRVVVRDLETSRSRVLWSEKREDHKPCFDPIAVLSPDGKRLVACHFDHILRCWEVDGGKLLWESPTQGPPPCLFFSPDGRTVVTNAGIGTAGLHLRDAATGKLLEGQAPPPREAVYPIGYSPDGRFLAFETGLGEVVLWQPGTDKVVFRSSNLSPLYDGVHMVLRSLPTNFAFTPDGTGLIRRAGTLQRWDLATGKPLYPDTESWGHAEEVTKLVFSPDGRLLASSAKDQRVRLWEVATARTLYVFPKGRSDHLAFTPDGRYLLTMPFDTRKAALRMWDVASGREERSFDLAEHAGIISFGDDKELRVTQDGKQALLLTWKNGGRRDESVLAVWDVATGACLRQQPVPWAPDSRLGPDGEGVLAFDYKAGRVKLLSVATAEPRLEFSSDRVPDPQQVPRGCDLALSPDGHLMAARAHFCDPQGPRGLESDDLRLGDLRTGQQVLKLRATGPAVFTFSADSRLFAVAGAEGARLWETASGKEVGAIAAPDREAAPPGRAFASALTFSPDGRLLATGHADGTILFWDATLRGGARGGLLARDEADALWADLAGADAGRAYRAVWRLVDDAGWSVQLLKERLRPVAAAPTEAVRGPSELLTGEALRGLRGVQVLERIGSPEARDTLERLAGGRESAGLTRAAKEALARMAREGRP
jgi:RNA polymerase sigma factor (sigma-70 family)